jgi:hypothetical protein
MKAVFHSGIHILGTATAEKLIWPTRAACAAMSWRFIARKDPTPVCTSRITGDSYAKSRQKET